MIRALLLSVSLFAAAAASASIPHNCEEEFGLPIEPQRDRISCVPGASVGLPMADLAPGRLYRFWFSAGGNRVGQNWFVPVIVIKGLRPGPRLVVTAGIHGDELNGIAVVHQLATLDPKTLAGTLVMVPGLNTPGLLASTREFPDGSNLNRLMPGAETGAAARYAKRLWDGLLRPNTDAAVDLHTQSRGTAYVMYAFASTPRTRRMAELVGPDILKMDTGDKGTVENELTRDGVPAITFELGRPEVFDAASVARGVAGLKNLMTEMGMIAGTVQATAPHVTNRIQPARTTRAGWMTLLAPLGSDVVKGQPLATIADAFGRTIETVLAPESGRINTIATDPRRDAGDMVARIVWWDPDPKCALGC
ncbi:MAG: succinylglutamate desuccinylase/aspartoacylase family protein [Polymorphobacter sp.]